VAFAVLVWRDGYIHPAEPTGAEAVTDGLIVSSCIAAAQLLLLFMSAPFAMTPRTFLPGLALGVTLISGWRFVFRRKKLPQPPALDAYQSTSRLNRLWIVALLFLAATNAEIAPSRDAQEAFFQLAPPILFVIDYRLRSKAIGGIMSPKHSLSLSDADKKDLL